MTYAPSLNPRRGLMIEKCQPFTNVDVDLAKKILSENDELVVCVGSADKSHEPGYIMTAGERVELVDAVLAAEGLERARYVVLPVPDHPEPEQWVATTMAYAPRIATVYTRNFKNAAMLESLSAQYGYEVSRLDVQKERQDFFALVARNGPSAGLQSLALFVSSAAIDYMRMLGIEERVSAIYNRVNVRAARKKPCNNALFLGGMQPPTGVVNDGTGHLGTICRALETCSKVVIAVGSAQASMMDSDPLTPGQRIEVIRYALLMNGVGADKFFTIPVPDISANFGFAAHVVTLCPAFDKVIAGNDWTKELFGRGNYQVVPVGRSCAKGTEIPISATRVRTIAKEVLKNPSAGTTVSESVGLKLADGLAGLVDSHAMAMLEQVGFFSTMQFLARARE